MKVEESIVPQVSLKLFPADELLVFTIDVLLLFAVGESESEVL